MWEYKEQLFSKRKFAIKVDEEVLKTLTLLPSFSRAEDQADSSPKNDGVKSKNKSKKKNSQKDLIGERERERETGDERQGKRNCGRSQNQSQQTKIETVNSGIIRKHFEQLTENFLQPLQMCFDSLWYAMKAPFMFRSELEKIFLPQKFIDYIIKHG